MSAMNEPTGITDVAPTKQELIVSAARKLFLSASYSGISMDAIAAEAGVSKATVYSHFQNKEALFAGVMRKMCEESSGPKVSDELAGPPEDVLLTMGLAITHKLLEPEILSLFRTVLSGVTQFPELGRTYWEEGPGYARDMLTTYFTELNRRGELSVLDPGLAAMQFIGLATGPFFLPLILGAQEPPAPAEVERIVDRAVAIFLAGVQGK
jgi:TetR/AcrR family transcriptional regulator, mexJK operon transcriptional repressor